ncbi:protein zer-1 homolog [Parasteatoda tepidariorum]|uniref:protein zer-1 homolog n=1 Tax=Parasteatoda tepidariorum TaxID=114398 RepID=UPI0039BD8583
MAFRDFPTVWVPNSPDTLLDISLFNCCKNPLTFCTFHPSLGYRLREGLALPQEICERMLEVCRTQMCDDDFYKFIRIFADSPTRLRHVDLRDTPVRDSDLVVFLYHPITELNLKGCTKLNRGALKCLSKFSGSLQTLILGSNPDLFNDDDIPAGSFEGTAKEDTSSKTRREDVPSGSLDGSFRSSQLAQKLAHHPQIALHPQLGSFFNVRNPKLTEEDFFRDCMRIWLTKDEPKKDETLKLLDSLPKLTSLPMLRKLVIHELTKTGKSVEFLQVIKTTSRLTHLDLSHSKVWGFESFVNHPLLSLVLYNVKDCIKDCLPSIYLIKTIRHLDISSTEAHTVKYENPNQVLKTIVDNLVNLTSLDISGTNLAGKGTIERFLDSKSKVNEDDEEETSLTDIPGLASRVHRPLEFLGLLNCSHQACYRHHIPAIRIAGDNGEEQILTAGQAYCTRESAIQKVLNDLFSLFRFSECKNIPLALDIIMEAMRIHLRKKSIQVAGSASLFYIVKSEHKETFNVKIRRYELFIYTFQLQFFDYERFARLLLLIVSQVDQDDFVQRIGVYLLNSLACQVDGIEKKLVGDQGAITMLRNGCLALIHFKIPEDMFFDYERFARLLLLIVSQVDQDDFVQRIGVYLLNSLACQVDGIEKKLVGDQGAITIMLQLIEKRLERRICDEVMETAWSTMWNVTDETPINCERFLEGNGMDLFLRCLEAFPSKAELLRNMIGLLGNVAEVKELRKFLMKEDYLSVFRFVCFVFMHYYRSFKPILRLLSVYHTPEAQIWAVWALANLTKVYPEKYCMLLKKEGGITLLESLLQQGNPQITRLAQMTIDHCMRYENCEDSDMSDNDDVEII